MSFTAFGHKNSLLEVKPPVPYSPGMSSAAQAKNYNPVLWESNKFRLDDVILIPPFWPEKSKFSPGAT